MTFQIFVSDYYYVTVSGSVHHDDDVVTKDDSTPIVICIPGLTSDSSSPVSYPIMLLYICVVKCLCCLVSLPVIGVGKTM